MAVKGNVVNLKWYRLLLIPLVVLGIAWLWVQNVSGTYSMKSVVDKSERRLYLVQGFRTVKSYPVVLGSNPRGDKFFEGDRRTPTGRFYICQKKTKSRTGNWLGLSYPGIEDAERGLRQGVIDEAEYRTIINAHKEKKTPPWNTELGGKIYIHGGGLRKKDWTKGCIAMQNRDVRDLCNHVDLGTEVIIRE
ncbi:MAG: L,D-transpeptidase [Deltaproteobacteria bacterium]|nr:L,D-transpeptidase [Deltaproteobacteria bacterium]